MIYDVRYGNQSEIECVADTRSVAERQFVARTKAITPIPLMHAEVANA